MLALCCMLPHGGRGGGASQKDRLGLGLVDADVSSGRAVGNAFFSRTPAVRRRSGRTGTVRIRLLKDRLESSIHRLIASSRARA